MNYFHGGNVAVPHIDPYIYGADDELLCASASINVAKRYGDVITALTLNDLAAVKRMTIKEWFTVDESSKNLVADLRKTGITAIIVEGDKNSFDFPVETVFVLSPEALKFDRVLSEEEAIDEDNGIPSSYPCGPASDGWGLYVTDLFSGDLHEALRANGWDIFEDGCLRASVPRNKMFREWLGLATPRPDGTCIIETNFCTDRIEMPSVTEALKVLDRWRIEKIEEWGVYMSNDEQWSTVPPLGTWADDENPLYPMSDWRHEVANEDTRLGYLEWLEHKIECAADDARMGVSQAGGILCPANNKETDRVEWETEVVFQLEEKLDATTSDAQGIMEAHQFAVSQAWGRGLDAAVAADHIIGSAATTFSTVFGDENFRCQCGNTSHHEGFHPCDAAGVYQEPDKGWDCHYKCDRCQKVYQLP